MIEQIKFGDYCQIEQKRHGVPNEMYLHKVIGTLRSNAYVDVPVQSPAKETIHDEITDVVACICCGVQETEVRKYRLCDIILNNHLSPQAGQNEIEAIIKGDHKNLDIEGSMFTGKEVLGFMNTLSQLQTGQKEIKSKPNVFDVFKEMNMNDEENKTATLSVSPYFESANKTKQGGVVKMGVAENDFWDIMNEKKMCVLLCIDKEIYNKLIKTI